eukprot:scaffold167165_cov71-Attheya_sp.AAC.1
MFVCADKHHGARVFCSQASARSQWSTSASLCMLGMNHLQGELACAEGIDRNLSRHRRKPPCTMRKIEEQEREREEKGSDLSVRTE